MNDGPLNRLDSAADSVPSAPVSETDGKVVGARAVDPQARGGKRFLELADVGTPFEQVRRQSRRHARQPPSNAAGDALRATCGVNTSRGDRPVSAASADSYCAIARSATAMSAATAAPLGLGLREVVIADDARLRPVGLQPDRLVAQRQRIAQTARVARRTASRPK